MQRTKIEGLTSLNRLLANESAQIRLSATTESLPAFITTLRSSLEGLDGVLAPYRISFADVPTSEAKDVEQLDAD
ncbi:hypothetical protein BS47DRAFT_1346250 [Hydnum rufescens UP504]|uniref:Uncharacterized protein n=1 Tax=Hydnum rufescens UP504 TaxID=1448309 RepID=A0A9P6DUP0_9AGAM|nr:hypothetical protein BS47DRAFT_1346250 [Hydnum rufescens UP504]